jgi:hypothetical protein
LQLSCAFAKKMVSPHPGVREDIATAGDRR